MRNNEKRMILILIVITILIFVVWRVVTKKDNKKDSEIQENSISEGEFTKVIDEEGTKVNTSEKLKEEKEAYGFKITNISFEEKGGETILTATVTNNTGSNQKAFWGNIVLLNKSEIEIARIPVMITDTLNGETINVKATITESYANAYNFKLEK